MCCVSHSGHSIVLSQPNHLLQIQTPQAVSGSVVAMPTLSQDKPVAVAAPPLLSVTLRTPSSDDDVSQSKHLGKTGTDSVRLIQKMSFNLSSKNPNIEYFVGSCTVSIF